MKLKPHHLVVFAIALAAGACHRDAPKQPTGQVVATVGSREITLRELRAELSAVPPVTSLAARKTQQQQVVQLMVQRTALAEAARKQGLDKDPNFTVLLQRATDTLLVQQLQTKIAAAVPAPTQESASQFIAANPNLFAERKIFDVEQIRLPRPADATILAKLQPLKTLDEIAAFLTQNRLGFQRGLGSIDSVGQNPKLISAIVGLPPGEVFVVSVGNQVLINQIRSTRTDPFTGEPANKYALNLLRAQNTQAAVQRQLSGLLAKARPDIRIAKDYEAPKAPASAKPSAAKPGG